MKTPRQLLAALARFRHLSLRNTLYLRSRQQGRELKVYVGRSVYCHAGPDSKITGSGVFHLGATWEHSRAFPSEFRMLPGAQLHVQTNACLRLGTGYINSGVRIDCWKSISLGEGVVIGPDVVICDSDSHRLGGGDNPDGAIVLEDHVWIGARVMILKGVTIGEGAVIAAGSIVVKDIPARSLAAGVPAKVVRQDIEWK